MATRRHPVRATTISDRRASRRYPISLECEVLAGEPHARLARLVEISSDGAVLDVAPSLETGQLVTVHVDWDGLEFNIPARGLGTDGELLPVSRVRFEGANDEQKAAITELIAAAEDYFRDAQRRLVGRTDMGIRRSGFGDA